MVRPKHTWDLQDVADERILAAMKKVPRHLFVPDDLAEQAYENRALPIGRGQTTSQPLVVATMIEALHVKQSDRVLEIGTGSGYPTAVLAELADQVYSVEIEPALSEQAAKRLKELGYRNTKLRTSDGYEGWVEEAPFDAIIVTAAVEDVPPALMDQLKDGGRLVVPLGTPFGPQELTLVEKRGREIVTRSLMPVQFVSFRRSLG